MAVRTPMILLLGVCAAVVCQGAAGSAERPSLDVWYLGSLDSGLHGIQGSVYAASADTLLLRGFSYDGRAPSARFIAGTWEKPDGNGILVRDERGSDKALKAYRNQTIVLKLPAGNTITDFKWFSVYDRKAKRSFAHVYIPAHLNLPGPAVAATHLLGDHANATALVIEDQKTLLLKNFYYDGSAPGTYFLVGKGRKPGPKGIKLLDEKGRTHALGKYAGANLRFTLPGNLTVDDVDWFAVYCTGCSKSLVQGTIPKRLNVPHNARWIKRVSRLGLLKMHEARQDTQQFTNCETIVQDAIQVGWKVEKDDITFNVRAVAGNYMWTAFGVSGAADKSQMVGADVAVIFVAGANHDVSVKDFMITAKAQCSGSDGVCPDFEHGGKEDLTLKSKTYADGIVDVVYSRKLDTGDAKDKAIASKGEVAVVAAQGPVNMQEPETVLYHTNIVTRQNVLLEFGREPKSNCAPLPSSREEPSGAAKTYLGGRDIFKAEGVKNFTATIGPTGSPEHGYQAITGMSGWGISWWINGELIPVLHVERGQTYTFVVEGGNNKSAPSKYHPFYITDSPKGGGSKVNPEEVGKPGHSLLAGVVLDDHGNVNESKGLGRYCHYEESRQSDAAKTLEEYKNSVKKECDPGDAGTFTWTPDDSTPDLVYYQCFTHFYLGWKIVVTDKGASDPPMGVENAPAKPVGTPTAAKHPATAPPPHKKPPPHKPPPHKRPPHHKPPHHKKPPADEKPPPAKEEHEESSGSQSSGQAVRPALPPFLIGCAAVLVTLLIGRNARDRHL
ncbi:protein Skeletor, isoforms B/C-like isoform X1 [Dermacentor albipictus]|uniref:protein Skeletor, isoforms B/C-like isoform X1 n=1 Tax=Dermacentor albipictus TaxID=60249 RepID=UPI0038FC0BD8